jgi:large subunit ribosomal protein L6
MSRIAKKPLHLPTGVSLVFEGEAVVVKGPKGSLSASKHALVDLVKTNDVYQVMPKSASRLAWVQAGTLRALINNMMIGVSQGFERKLDLVGVGYRAQSKGNVISLTIGFSHPVEFELPNGIYAVTPSQTEIVLSGNDNQKLGQVAAEIRSLRPPEPYKGKGIQYKGEKIHRKEAKKK